MKITGIDRIAIMVRDPEKALEIFSDQLGMEFLETEREISERDGVQSYVCPDLHLHLFSPIFPLPSNAAPPMKKRVDLLKEHEAVFMAVTFKVDDIEKIEAELIHRGIAFQHKYEESSDYASTGMDNFAEIITSPETTLGLVLGFAKYVRNKEKEKKHSANTKPIHEGKVKSLDRIVVVVRDMEKALDLFSGKLGMEFRELSKEIQERDGNIGYVCHDTHIHLVQPRLPLPEGAPLPLKRGAEMLAEKEGIVLILIFKVDNPKAVGAELKLHDIDTLRTWEENSDYVTLGMDNLVEILVDPEKTMGIPLCFSRWDPC